MSMSASSTQRSGDRTRCCSNFAGGVYLRTCGAYSSLTSTRLNRHVDNTMQPMNICS